MIHEKALFTSLCLHAATTSIITLDVMGSVGTSPAQSLSPPQIFQASEEVT
jgi:hypothetical protein